MKCPLNADMHMKKTFSIGFVALLLLSLVMVMFLPVNAEHPAQAIWVEPASNYFKLSESFTVDVKINITDPDGPATGLFGFEYKLKWNSTILNCTSYTKCDPVADLGWGNYFEVADSLTAGRHRYAVSALVGPTTTPFTGIVTLATYTFHVTAKGNCTLDLYETEFTDDTATIIISDTIPTGTTVDSYFSTPYPRALFTYSPEFPLVNETVTFDAGDSDDPDGTIVSYAWDFGDDTTDTGVIVNHNYTAAGTYKVNLTVTDDDTRTDTIIKDLKVGGIAALFTYSPSNPLANETVTFNATASFSREGYILNHTWNFGDTNITTTTSPIMNHSYIDVGIYNVTLTVTDNASLTDTTWHIVKVGRWPVVIFTYSPSNPLANQTVRFDAGDSYDPDGTIVNYAWDFGDDTTDTGMIVNHNYTAAGTYTVNLTVTDDDALTSSTSVLITVLEKPLASFTWSPEEPEVGETVTFDASASSDRDGDIVDYEWNFGDGIEESGPDPITTKTYTIGTYNVTLTVTDDDKLTDVITKLITVVKASSIISISVSSETIKVGEDTVISGSITPAREDANVTIYYRLTGGVAWDTTTVTTSSTGGYSYTWTPDEAGTYEVKASWPGDGNNLGAESSIKTVTVEEEAEPPPPDYLLYVVIVIVIVILAAVAIYFLKIRKS